MRRQGLPLSVELVTTIKKKTFEMKKLLITALVGLSSAALSLSSANAQSQITSVPGDVILGFYATSGSGSGVDLEVDLGSVTKFINATPGTVFNLSGSTGLALADLTSTYGANWASDPNLFWGTAASNQTTQVDSLPNYSLFATDPETTPGTLSTPWQAGNRFQQQPPSGLIASLYTGLNQSTSTANSSVSNVIPTSQGDSYFFDDVTSGGGGISFEYFQPSSDNNVTNTNASGNSISDFYELLQTNAGNNGQLLGKFELNSNGTFEFVAVPEPSTMGLTGVGFLSLIGLVALRRRRSLVA